MQFLKSLFCLQGFDNRSRYLLIFSVIYILFIMLSPVLKDNIFIFVFITTLFTLLLAFTSVRRLHDAKLNRKWLLSPCLTFILVATIIVFTEQSSSYYLLIIPTLCSSVLLAYPSAKKQLFILGYYGPVDMREYQTETIERKQVKLRIEPTILNTNSVNIDNTNQSTYPINNPIQNNYIHNSSPFNNQGNIVEVIRLKIVNNKTTQLIIATVIGIAFIAFSAVWLLSLFNKATPPLEDNNVELLAEKTEIELLRYYPLPMPNNYTLYLTDHGGISINWQADEVNDTILWSQATIQGDETCKEISFDKGESIRTLSVRIESSTADTPITLNDYFAYFSPLDSNALIQALALRSSFSLCGYNFSLKGSQAVLAGHEQYAQWLGY